MATIAVAGLSARMMAQAAVRDGFGVVALDLFGDVDTRRIATRWFAIGEPQRLQLDPTLTLSALEGLAQRGDVAGWVAGSGFEGQPELLDEAAQRLPLIGMAPAAVARLRDPARFFGFLERQGIGCPPTRLDAPLDAAEWLLKDARGCGGWHIRRAPPDPSEPVPPHHYFQRETPGLPMSATFVANGRRAQVLGFNRLIVRPLGDRPHVFCGVVGPLALPHGVARRVQAIVAALTQHFELRGLCSLDFLLEGTLVSVLEVNPRPPASIALYADQQPMAAHVRACLDAELPPPAPASTVHGLETVFARHPIELDAATADLLSQRTDVHDVPHAGQYFEGDQAVCTLSASGHSELDVLARLQSGREALWTTLERHP